MTTDVPKSHWSVIAGLLLTFPAVYFIFICVMKYQFNLPVMYDKAEPVLQSFGTNKLIGWNINFLIVFGPLIALLLNVSSVVSLFCQSTTENYIIQFTIKKRTMNWSVIFLSAFCLVAFFMYLFKENCSCT